MLAVRGPSVPTRTRTTRREGENEEEIKMRKWKMKSVRAESEAGPPVITADLWLPAASQASLSPTLSEWSVWPCPEGEGVARVGWWREMGGGGGGVMLPAVSQQPPPQTHTQSAAAASALPLMAETARQKNRSLQTEPIGSPRSQCQKQPFFFFFLVGTCRGPIFVQNTLLKLFRQSLSHQWRRDRDEKRHEKRPLCFLCWSTWLQEVC